MPVHLDRAAPSRSRRNPMQGRREETSQLLAAAPLRVAFVEEGGDPFDRVFGGEGD